MSVINMIDGVWRNKKNQYKYLKIIMETKLAYTVHITSTYLKIGNLIIETSFQVSAQTDP